jgi:hypothetical protein
MAAITVRTPSSTLLAVDASRMAGVMPWPRGISGSSLSATARRLDPPTAPAVNLAGGPVRLTATTGFSQTRVAPRDLDLGLWVANPEAGTTIADLGPLHAGQRTYRGALAELCSGGCRLAGLGLIQTRGRGAPYTGTARVTLTGFSVRSAEATWVRLAADLFPGGWRATAAGVRIVPRAAGGLTFVLPAAATGQYTTAVGFAGSPMAAPADHPGSLPGAVTSEVQSLNGITGTGGAVPGQGLDGNTLNILPAVTASALPRVGSNAVMVDLDLLQRSQVDPTSTYAVDEVWLGPGAPGDALARLQAAGLRVDRAQKALTVSHELNRSAPALADDFLLVATIFALFAAAASTLGALGANTRERATELTALEVGGVSRRALAGSLALESGALALTALFGVGAGVVAALMAIPSLPELGSPAVIPLRYGLPGGLVAAVSGAVVVVILLAGALVSAVLVRRMSPALLRVAPNDSAG